MAFGDRLRKAREMRKMSQEQLGRLIGVRDATINRYEKGNRHPDPNTIRRLANILDVSADYLLDNDTNDSNDNNYQLHDLPLEIQELITDPNNHLLLKTLKKMVDQGYSHEAIVEWMEMLGPVLHDIGKKYGDIYQQGGRVFYQDENGVVSEKIDKTYGRKPKKKREK